MRSPSAWRARSLPSVSGPGVGAIDRMAARAAFLHSPSQVGQSVPLCLMGSDLESIP